MSNSTLHSINLADFGIDRSSAFGDADLVNLKTTLAVAAAGAPGDKIELTIDDPTISRLEININQLFTASGPQVEPPARRSAGAAESSVDDDGKGVTSGSGLEVASHNKHELTITTEDGERLRLWGDPHATRERVGEDGRAQVDTSVLKSGEFMFTDDATFVAKDGTRIDVATAPTDPNNPNSPTYAVAARITTPDGKVSYINDIDSEGGGEVSTEPDEDFDPAAFRDAAVLTQGEDNEWYMDTDGDSELEDGELIVGTGKDADGDKEPVTADGKMWKDRVAGDDDVKFAKQALDSYTDAALADGEITAGEARMIGKLSDAVVNATNRQQLRHAQGALDSYVKAALADRLISSLEADMIDRLSDAVSKAAEKLEDDDSDETAQAPPRDAARTPARRAEVVNLSLATGLRDPAGTGEFLGSGGPIAASDPAADFVRGAVLGDFDENRTVAGALGQTLTGYIPGVAQLADVRDVMKAVVDVAQGRDGSVTNLALSLVGLVPGIGDTVKSGARTAAALNLIENTAQVAVRETTRRLGDETGGVAPGEAFTQDRTNDLTNDVSSFVAGWLTRSAGGSARNGREDVVQTAIGDLSRGITQLAVREVLNRVRAGAGTDAGSFDSDALANERQNVTTPLTSRQVNDYVNGI